MIWEIPQSIQDLILERALGASAVEKAKHGLLPTELLRKTAAALSDLSNTFTAEREQIKKQYLDQSDVRRAYLLYYLQSNLPKVWYVLREIQSHPAGLLKRDQIRLLDLGSGSGTVGLAIATHLSSRDIVYRLRITAIDNSRSANEDYRWLIQGFSRNIEECGRQLEIEVNTLTANLENQSVVEDEKYDLIVFSNSLNELFHGAADAIEKRARYIDRICRIHLVETGSCVVIEPALQSVSRSFHQVRERLIDAGWHLYSPCVADRPCPMLARDRDWCHQTIDWRRPSVVKQLDEMIGNRKERLKFSYAVFRKDEFRMTNGFSDTNLFRAVGDLQREKGKDMIYLCGRDQPLPHTLLKRDRTPENKSFLEINRGDLVEIKGETERERITTSNTVNIVDDGEVNSSKRD